MVFIILSIQPQLSFDLANIENCEADGDIFVLSIADGKLKTSGVCSSMALLSVMCYVVSDILLFKILLYFLSVCKLCIACCYCNSVF